MKKKFESNEIHPTAIIGPDVKIGNNNYIGPNVHIVGNTVIGDNNYFTASVSVGYPAQHRKVKLLVDKKEKVISNSDKQLIIGNNNIFREFSSVNAAFVEKTEVASNCYIMSYAHISHDSILEENVTLCNNVQIGGHCVIMKNSTLGLSSVISQFNIIGSYAMIGMGTAVSKSLIPFSKSLGSPAVRIGINSIGLDRSGFNEREISSVEEVSQFFLSNHNLTSFGEIDEKISNEFYRYMNYLNKTLHK